MTTNTKRKIPPAMIEELKKTYIQEGLGTFEKTLFYLTAIEGIAREDIERLERIVKLECHNEKLKTLALAYIDDDSLLNKLYINLELRFLNISKTTFLEIVNELKSSSILAHSH